MKKLVLLGLFAMAACAHTSQYDSMKLECPDGRRVEIKVPVSDNPHLMTTAMQNRARATCGIPDGEEPNLGGVE